MNNKANKKMFIMILGLSFLFTSCGSTKNIDTEQEKFLNSISQEDKAVSTSFNIGTFTDFEVSVTEGTLSEAQKFSIEEKKFSKINKDTLTYDYSDLKSNEMINAFNSRKYTFTYFFPSTETRQTISCNGDSAVITNEYYNLKYASLYKEEKSYLMYKDRYCQNVVTEDEIIKVTEFFENLGYDSSGDIKVNDIVCQYERFYNKEMNSEFIFIFDESGVPVALKNDGIEMKIEFFSPNIDEELFEIPESSKEIPESEMWTQLSTDLQR